MSHAARFFVLGAAFLLAANFCILTGLIVAWGRWYSPSPAYRLQTDAFLNGNIAISDSPVDVLHDFAWAEGGVQQVWGLGVPLIRLPFEAVARITGQQAFPDRLVLLAALSLFYAGGITVLLRPSESDSIGQWLTGLFSHPFRVAAFLAVAFFPSVTTFCMGAFNVYEEAVLAGYLAACGLFLALLSLIRRPRWSAYVALSVAAGLIPLVRATAGSYGAAAMLVAALVAVSSLGRVRALTGMLLYGAGSAVVLWSNINRFGDGMEFGHQLNISGGDLTYMSRFGGPYDDEKFVSAAMELFGSIFGVLKLNGFDCYASNVMIFQSPTLRWRHFYAHTFDVSHLIIVVILLGWGYCMARGKDKGMAFVRTPLGAATLWFLTSSFVLSAFYLRFHALSSRYTMDFAPAIAGLICAGLLQLDEATACGAVRRRSEWMMVAIAALWFIGEIIIGSQGIEPTPVLYQAEALSTSLRPSSSNVVIPSAYMIPGEPGKLSPAEQLVRGWHTDGTTEPLVLLYVSDVDAIVLDVAPAADFSLAESAYRDIRAKVGLEELKLESIIRTANGRRIVFAAPHHKQNKDGVHMLFLAMASPEDILRSKSYFILNGVTSTQPSRSSD